MCTRQYQTIILFMFPVTLLWQNHTWYTHNDFECLYVMLKRIKCKNCRGLLRYLSMDGTWIELSCKSRISPPALEMRRNMDGDGMQISRPGWRWDTMWMEEGCNYKKLNGGEPGHGWRWDTHPETWMGLRWDLAGIEMQQDGVEMLIMGPGWRWDVIWMEFRR